MRLFKFYLLGLGAWALISTQLRADFVDCPKGNEITYNSMKSFPNFNPFKIGVEGPIDQGIELIRANENQTCFYTYGMGVEGFEITKRGGNAAWCPVVNTPSKIGFDCS